MIIFVVLRNFGGQTASLIADGVTVLVLAILAPRATGSGRAFVLIAIGLVIYALAMPSAPDGIIKAALDRASFIIAFFCALATLRHAANLSPAVTRAAVFLSSQPPGRRYNALTIGVQIFALVLNYGAISLLGGMSRSSAMKEPDQEIRDIRLRRMLQAVHRGFAASVCWSPLSFAMVISISIIPGADLRSILLPAIVSAAILVGVGWALDTMFKPRLTGGKTAAPPDRAAASDVKSLWPLLGLLAAICLPSFALELVLGLPLSMAVLIVVPSISAIWLFLDGAATQRFAHLSEHAKAFCFNDLPSFRNEIILLSMAGFIGSLAGALLAPVVAASGLDLSALPVWVILMIPIIVIPVTGQLGMNPILCVSLFGPLLPEPSVIGVAPTAMVLSLTAGWAMSAVTSPFTASVMLIARLGDVKPSQVSFQWNGLFTLAAGAALTVWVMCWM
ncbi:hypothetical protein BFP70_02650 [Thioclava sp. SK-1]|nr:hypothetical protein BFP70_02650 [Thioclava sp. SK-1]